MRHQAAHWNPGIRVEVPEHRLKDHPPDIFKIHIHAIGASFGQLLDQVLTPMADTRVEPERIHHVPTFLFSACDTHHAASLNLGDLPNDGPDCARCRRHHHGLTRHRLANVQKADVGSEAWHTQYAERR